MKKKSFVSALTAFTLSIPLSLAHAYDVNPGKAHYVRVTRTGDLIKFEDCFRGVVPECVRTIGNKTEYSVKELQSQRMVETLQGYGSIVADIAFLTFFVTVGGFAGTLVLGTAQTTAPTLIGGAVGAAGYSLTALNPVEQFKQASVIKESVLIDRDVHVENISVFISRLKLVLSKL